MLTTGELRRILGAGTGQRIEIMPAASATPSRIARALVSLANAEGGVLVVRADGGPRAPTDEELLTRGMEAVMLSAPRLIMPMPYLVREPGAERAEALVLEVPQGLPQVYTLDDRYLARRDGHIVPLGARALRELLLNRTDSAWEAAAPTGSANEDIAWKAAEDYARAVLGSGEGSVEDVLLRRGCLVKKGRKTRPTHAGLLLFGRQPQRWVRGAEVLCARFVGVEMGSAFARLTAAGTLPEQIRKVEAFLAENLATQSALGAKGAWQRQDKPAYPPGVLREAVVNAVAHRDYQLLGAQVHVLVFSDRVEVRSPGRLPGHVTLKNLVRERYSRNEAIVQVLADMGYIERLGYGIDRMLRVLKEAGHEPPEFEETDNGFAVTLHARELLPLAAGSAAPAPQMQRIDKMITFLRDHGRITNREYQDLCPDVSAESLRRDFVELVERGQILRVGDKRGTYYILK